jgi:hypothetical protein
MSHQRQHPASARARKIPVSTHWNAQKRLAWLARAWPGFKLRAWAVAAGAGCALALPPLVGLALDLSVFAGSGVPVPLRPDRISLGLPAVAALLVAAAALATEARRLSRRGVARMLRAE